MVLLEGKKMYYNSRNISEQESGQKFKIKYHPTGLIAASTHGQNFHIVNFSWV